MDGCIGIYKKLTSPRISGRVHPRWYFIELGKPAYPAVFLVILILVFQADAVLASAEAGDRRTLIHRDIGLPSNANGKQPKTSVFQAIVGGVRRREKRSSADPRTRANLHRIPRIQKKEFTRLSLRRAVRRRKRESTRQPSPVESTAHLTIWQHNCHINKRAYSPVGATIIFECVPSSIRILDTTGNDGLASPAGITAYPVANVTNVNIVNISDTSQSPRPVRDMYALNDAILQFSVPNDVTELRLWYQGIVSIEKNAFHKLGSTLQVLNLQQNGISYLSMDAFAGLADLTELDLSYNRLQSIPSLAFRHLPKLEVLNLDHNEISFIQNSLFCGLRSLVTLDLTHNAIEDVGPHALQHFTSPYTVSIELGHNKLSRPRKDWLERVPFGSNAKICTKEDGNSKMMIVSPLVTPVVPNVTVGNVVEVPVAKVGTLDAPDGGIDPIRILRAAYNPWYCACDPRFDLIKFLRTYHSLATSHPGGAVGANPFSNIESNSTFGANSLNATSKKRYYRWYLTMPCMGPSGTEGMDLGRLLSGENSNIEGSCCEVLTGTESGDKILGNDPVLGVICTENTTNETVVEPDESSENQVTIIGIVIVFSTPILLTLCPDCDKAIHPSGGRGMVSAGKFGVSMNTTYNNNVYPETHDMFRNSELRPMGTERLCGILRTKDSDYAEDVV